MDFCTKKGFACSSLGNQALTHASVCVPAMCAQPKLSLANEFCSYKGLGSTLIRRGVGASASGQKHVNERLERSVQKSSFLTTARVAASRT